MFYIRFDKAFMELYPNFVEELNTLLKPEHHIVLPPSNELTTEVRIYALMRLGVTDSQEIATLLYYSTPVSYTHLDVYKRQAYHIVVSCHRSHIEVIGYPEQKTGFCLSLPTLHITLVVIVIAHLVTDSPEIGREGIEIEMIINAVTTGRSYMIRCV